jgi:hypothetical protein
MFYTSAFEKNVINLLKKHPFSFKKFLKSLPLIYWAGAGASSIFLPGAASKLCGPATLLCKLS